MFYSGSLDTYHAGNIVKSKVKKKYSLAPPRETTGRLTGDSHLPPVTPFPIPPSLIPSYAAEYLRQPLPSTVSTKSHWSCFSSHTPSTCARPQFKQSVLPDAQVSPARGGKFAPLSWLFQIKSSKLTHSSETEHWLQPSLPSYTSSPVDPMDLLSSSSLSLLSPSPQP